MSKSRNKGILVVDDEPIARQSVRDILRLEGYDTFDAPNAMSAIKYFRMHKDSLDLIIMDLRMPGIDGIEVLKKFKEKYNRIIFIMLICYTITL